MTPVPTDTACAAARFLQAQACGDCLVNAGCASGMAGAASCKLLDEASTGTVPDAWHPGQDGGWACEAYFPLPSLQGPADSKAGHLGG